MEFDQKGGLVDDGRRATGVPFSPKGMTDDASTFRRWLLDVSYHFFDDSPLRAEF